MIYTVYTYMIYDDLRGDDSDCAIVDEERGNNVQCTRVFHFLTLSFLYRNKMKYSRIVRRTFIAVRFSFSRTVELRFHKGKIF